MADVVRSIRLNEELFEAISEEISTTGVSFAAFVVEALESYLELEEDDGTEIEARDNSGDLKVVLDKVTSLGDVIKTSRLSHSELTESLIALSRIAKELDTERHKTLDVTKTTTKEMQRAEAELKKMTDMGMAASVRCQESVKTLEKASEHVEEKLEGTMGRIEMALYNLEKQASRVESKVNAELNKFHDRVEESGRDIRKIASDFRQEAVENVRTFVFTHAKKWHNGLLAVAGVSVFAFIGSYGFTIYRANEKVAAYQEEVEVIKKNYNYRGNLNSYFIQEACKSRVAEVPKNYCSSMNGKKYDNPMK